MILIWNVASFWTSGFVFLSRTSPTIQLSFTNTLKQSRENFMPVNYMNVVGPAHTGKNCENDALHY